jgi:MFS family permease
LLWITGIAVVGEIAPDDGRGLWIGTYNQVKSVASLCGDLIGGALLFLYGFGTAYTVLVALTIVSTIAVFTFVRDDPGNQSDPEDATGTETFVRLLKRQVIKSLVVFRFGFSFGKMAVIIFLPIYARTEFGMTALHIGGILAGGKLTKGIAQGYVGEFADHIGGLEWFIFAGTVGYALGTAFIPAAGYLSNYFAPLVLTGFGQELTLIPAFFVLFFAYTVLGIAESLRLPTSMALFVEEGEYYDAVAGSLSLRSVSWQFGAILGPLLVGGALDYLSVLAGFWLAAAFMIIAGFAFIALFKAEPPPDIATEVANDD